jgi:hypothetical protein
LTRDDVEKDLVFGGFLVFSCPLKDDAASTIRMLNESSHRVNSLFTLFNVVRYDHRRQPVDSSACSEGSGNRESGCIGP